MNEPTEHTENTVSQNGDGKDSANEEQRQIWRALQHPKDQLQAFHPPGTRSMPSFLRSLFQDVQPEVPTARPAEIIPAIEEPVEDLSEQFGHIDEPARKKTFKKGRSKVSTEEGREDLSDPDWVRRAVEGDPESARELYDGVLSNKASFEFLASPAGWRFLEAVRGQNPELPLFPPIDKYMASPTGRTLLAAHDGNFILTLLEHDAIVPSKEPPALLATDEGNVPLSREALSLKAIVNLLAANEGNVLFQSEAFFTRLEQNLHLAPDQATDPALPFLKDILSRCREKFSASEEAIKFLELLRNGRPTLYSTTLMDFYLSGEDTRPVLVRNHGALAVVLLEDNVADGIPQLDRLLATPEGKELAKDSEFAKNIAHVYLAAPEGRKYLLDHHELLINAAPSVERFLESKESIQSVHESEFIRTLSLALMKTEEGRQCLVRHHIFSNAVSFIGQFLVGNEGCKLLQDKGFVRDLTQMVEMNDKAKPRTRALAPENHSSRDTLLRAMLSKTHEQHANADAIHTVCNAVNVDYLYLIKLEQQMVRNGGIKVDGVRKAVSAEFPEKEMVMYDGGKML